MRVAVEDEGRRRERVSALRKVRIQVKCCRPFGRSLNVKLKG